MCTAQGDEKPCWKLFNTYIFSNHDISKFLLLLRKGVCLHGYLDDWEKLNETSLSEKEDFYSHLNMENINDQRYYYYYRDFKMKTFGEYHDLYV